MPRVKAPFSTASTAGAAGARPAASVVVFARERLKGRIAERPSAVGTAP